MFRTKNYTVEAVDRKTGELTGKPKKVWALWMILLVEFLGTFVMVFEIIAPSALSLDQFDWYNHIFGTFIMKAFWVAGFILILIFLLRWCSVNLNPAVTLAEVAAGHTTKQQAFWMILIQMVGGVCAAYAAFWMGSNMEVFAPGAADQYLNGTYTLDAVAPRLLLSANEFEWFKNSAWLAEHLDPAYMEGGEFTNYFLANAEGEGYFGLWAVSENAWMIGNTPIGFLAIVTFLEFAYTWLLLWSIVGAKKVSHNARPFLIFAVLMLVVTLGIHTNNIALNPARLMGPALVAQATGGVATLQYSVFFLLGELLAVLLIAKSFGSKQMKAAKKAYKKTGVIAKAGATTVTAVSTEEAIAAIRADEKEFKEEVKELVLLIQEDLEVTKARYEWVLKGNDPIETMTLEEVQEQIKEKKAQAYIDLDQPVAKLRKEFAKFVGFGADVYKQMLIDARKKAQLEEIEAKKAKIEEAKKAAAKDAKDAKATEAKNLDESKEEAKAEVKTEAKKEATEKPAKKAPKSKK